MQADLLLMNFVGGFLGLYFYQGLKQVIPETKLDKHDLMS